jgi:hypothetical protein
VEVRGKAAGDDVSEMTAGIDNARIGPEIGNGGTSFGASGRDWMRAMAVFLLAAVLLSGCGEMNLAVGEDPTVLPGVYRPKDYKKNAKWVDLNTRLLRYGRAALPGAPEGYWKLYFRKSKKESPATSGAGEVFLPDFWIENISFDFMDFVLAHEVAHDVLDHLIWGAESREQAEFEADERAIEIMAKADGVDLTKNSMRIVLKLYGRIFPPERVERMKEVLKNLK